MRRKPTLCLCAALLLCLLGGCGLAEPPVIQYRDRELPVAEGVPVNAYAAEAFSAQDGVVTYEGGTAQYGIDVSTHQGDIDWQAVKNDGVDFAIIRAGYRGYGADGLLHEDAKFQQNMRGALDAGLQVGVYFFSQALTADEAREEADLLLSLIEPYRAEIDYPVVFDWELIPDVGARTDGIDMSTLTDIAEGFCTSVAEAGFRPAVYFNQDLGYLSYDIARISAYDLWLAELNTVPAFYYDFQIWQYSHTGTVAGVSGNVDRNICFRSYP